MMNFYDYMQETSRTWNAQGSTADRIHIELGLDAEFGELCGELKKEFQHNKDLDKEKTLLEVGDIAYYLARFAIEYMQTDSVRGMAYKTYNASYPSLFELSRDLKKQLQGLIETKNNLYLHGAMLTISHILFMLGYTLTDCFVANLKKLADRNPKKFPESFLAILETHVS